MRKSTWAMLGFALGSVRGTSKSIQLSPNEPVATSIEPLNLARLNLEDIEKNDESFDGSSGRSWRFRHSAPPGSRC